MKLYSIMFVALTSFGAMAQAADAEASTCKDKTVKVECDSKHAEKKCDASEKKECKKGEAADKKCCDKAAKKECKSEGAADKKCCDKGASADEKACKSEGAAEKKECKSEGAADKKCCDSKKKECKDGDVAHKKSCHSEGGEMRIERRMEVRVEVEDGDTTITINGEPHEGGMPQMHWIGKPEMHHNAKPMLGVALKSDDKATGATISEVLPGSTAMAIGLKAGDVIYKVNKTTVTDHKSAVEAIGNHNSDSPIVIHYRRDGKKGKAQGYLMPMGGGTHMMKIHQLHSPEGEEKRVIIKKMVNENED